MTEKKHEERDRVQATTDRVNAHHTDHVERRRQKQRPRLKLSENSRDVTAERAGTIFAIIAPVRKPK